MSINCEKTRESLSLYIDCKLDDFMMQQIKSHLETCETCHNEFTHIYELVMTIRDLPEIPVPSGFYERLHKALIQESKLIKNDPPMGYLHVKKSNRRPASINWKRASGVAAAFLIVVAGVGLHNQGFFSQIYDSLYSADGAYESYKSGMGSSDSFASGEGNENQSRMMIMDESGQSAKEGASNEVDSPNRHAVETKIEDTFYLDIVDRGTLKYSLIQYTKIDENTENFMYNIEGTKNGIPVASQMTIRVDAQGIYKLSEE